MVEQKQMHGPVQRYASAILYYLLPLLIQNMFQVPQDLLCLYERVVEMVLYIAEHHSGEEESNIQRDAILLLDRHVYNVDAVLMLAEYVCHGDVEQKRAVGKKIIDTMLRIVRIWL